MIRKVRFLSGDLGEYTQDTDCVLEWTSLISTLPGTTFFISRVAFGDPSHNPQQPGLWNVPSREDGLCAEARGSRNARPTRFLGV